MNKNNNKIESLTRSLIISTLTFVSWSVFSSSLNANGALPYCFGSKSCQMGGAGIALARNIDSTFGNINPAQMGYVGNDIAIDPILVGQREKVDTSQTLLTALPPPLPSLPAYTGPLTNQKRVYGGAYAGFNYQINPKWSVGISTGGGGSQARYNGSIISPALPAPTRLETMAVLSSQILAFKPTCNESYGVSLIAGYLQMRNTLTQFPSGIVARNANRLDHAWGIGGRIGGQWNLTQYVSFGVAASTPVFFQKLKKYDDVLPIAPRIPPIVRGGFAFHAWKSTDFLFDLEGTFWGSTAFTGRTPPVAQGWRNTLTYKFGIQHKLLPDLTVRLGYNYGKTPVQKSYVLFNALNESLALQEHILTTGFSYYLNPAFCFDFHGSYAFNKTIKDNGNGPAGIAAKGLTMKARAFMLTCGFNIKY